MELRYVVPPESEGMRLGIFLRTCGVTAGLIKSVKHVGQGFFANGRSIHTDQIVHAGQWITFALPPEPATSVTPQPIPLSIVFEDEFAAVLNKPAGTVTATEDRSDPTVLDLLKDQRRKGLFPVGRLDKDTEGLLLITNDGETAHRLLSPRKHVDKVYYADVRGKVTEEDVRSFAEGVDIGDEKMTMPADLEILESGAISRIRLTIREGRFHQVKRMFQSVGKEVIYLKRLQMGSLVLDTELKPGEYRKLTKEEVDSLC